MWTTTGTGSTTGAIRRTGGETEDSDDTDEWDAADDLDGPLDEDLDADTDGESAGDPDPALDDVLDLHDLFSEEAAVPAGRWGGEEREQPVVSAWEVGTAAAIAGWLLDHQAEQIVEGVRAAVARPAAAPRAGHGQPAARRSPGPPIDWDATPLRIGDTLDRSRLAVTIALRLGADRPLGLDAAPVAAAGAVPGRPGVDRSALSFTVAVTRIVPDLPVWVMFDDRPGGFRAAELRATFADEGPAGRAYRFVASAEEAVAVVEWGLGRHGLRLEDFRWAGGF